MPEVTFTTPVKLTSITFSLLEAAEIEKYFTDFPDRKAFRRKEATTYELVVENHGSDYEGIVWQRLAKHHIYPYSMDTHDVWYTNVTLGMAVRLATLREIMRKRIQDALAPKVSTKWNDDHQSLRITILRELTREDYEAIRMALAT